MKRIVLAAMAVAILALSQPAAALAGQNSHGVLEKYARKLKWFHTEANEGQKLEVMEAAINAAQASMADAQLYMAYAYIEGVGVEKDPEKGMALLREAARNGSDDARAALKEMGEDLGEGGNKPMPEHMPDPVPQEAMPQKAP